VRRYSKAELLDMGRAREALEGLMARLAAEKPLLPEARAELQAAQDALDAAEATRDFARYHIENRRYHGLIETMGGPATPGVGWASGVERLAMLLAEAPAAPRPIVVVPVGEAAQATALKVMQDLRHAGHVVEMGYSGNLKKRLQRANKMNARAALLFGDEELAAGSATLRDLDSGEQELVSLDRLAEHLSRLS